MAVPVVPTTTSQQRPMLPRAVIFDMDGLLVDSEPIHAAAYVTAFHEFGLHLDPLEYRDHVTLGGGTIRDLYARRGGDPHAWPALFARKRELFARYLQENGSLLPGVEALLSALAEHGIPCVLATGAGRFSADVILTRFAIRHRFRLVLAGEDVRRAKPDPEVFHLAAERLQVRLDECVGLEDSPKGVQAASAAGLPCVAVPTAWTRLGDLSRAVRVVASLEEVTPELLRQISESHCRKRGI